MCLWLVYGYFGDPVKSAKHHLWQSLSLLSSSVKTPLTVKLYANSCNVCLIPEWYCSNFLDHNNRGLSEFGGKGSFSLICLSWLGWSIWSEVSGPFQKFETGSEVLWKHGHSSQVDMGWELFGFFFLTQVLPFPFLPWIILIFYIDDIIESQSHLLYQLPCRPKLCAQIFLLHRPQRLNSSMATASRDSETIWHPAICSRCQWPIHRHCRPYLRLEAASILGKTQHEVVGSASRVPTPSWDLSLVFSYWPRILSIIRDFSDHNGECISLITYHDADP